MNKRHTLPESTEKEARCVSFLRFFDISDNKTPKITAAVLALCLITGSASGCGSITDIPAQTDIYGAAQVTLNPSAAHPVPEIYSSAAPATGSFIKETPGPVSTYEPLKSSPIDAVLSLTKAEFRAEVKKYICFYREIAFASEYGEGTPLVRKWDYEPVFYIYPSDDAEKYAADIQDHINDLCRLPGFPGFKYTDDPEEATFKLKFVTASEMNELTEGYGEQAFGLTSVTWLNFNCHVIRAEVYIVREADCSPEDVHHAILEEITQAMGLLNDSYEYTDSIFYQGYSTTPELSYIDWLMLRLHYAVEINAGMEYDEVLHVIDEP